MIVAMLMRPLIVCRKSLRPLGVRGVLFELSFFSAHFAGGRFGFVGRKIEIVVPNPPQDAFAAHAQIPYFAAGETLPGVETEEGQDRSLEETGTRQAAHVRFTADPANAGCRLRRRS
jgi:hypothetical protein